MKWIGIFALVLSCFAASPAFAVEEAPIGFESLLREMLDREALARFPAPGYTCRQFSSYDPASVSPAENDTWFANGDRGHYLRVEEVSGRKEWVMMDAEGPGAVVRIWSANPAGVMRVYIDDAEEPVIEGPMTELLGGSGAVAEPLSAQRSKGWNLYLPIPYAKRCKITSDAGNFYYQINYRTYEAGTAVESLTAAGLAEKKGLVEEVQAKLLSAGGPSGSAGTKIEMLSSPQPGQQIAFHLPPGPAAVQVLTVKLGGEDLAEALRTTVLMLVFDGETTAWCPVGDFFGTGVGLIPSSDWWRTVHEDGSLTCRWIMPYREKAELRFENLGGSQVKVAVELTTLPAWKWDDRSMYFHATWRQENPIHTRPMHDWNYVEVAGKGVYVGDNLAVANPVETWWGEGDEKIWVDGEDFPSHFGTGTEDYYGYAWCSPEPFQAPFHNQPRCDGPGNFGHTLISRVRALDGIPFQSTFKFDMEVWHWKECDEGYAATTYYYALPGATTNRAPSPEEAARGVLDPPPLPPPFKIEGALECEELEIVGRTDDINIGPQGGFPGIWSGEQQLWVQGREPGHFVELKIPVPEDGEYQVELFATRSWDYGIVSFSINGESTGLGVDLYNIVNREVATTGAMDLGVHAAKDGALILRAEVMGGNPASEGSRSFFGLDCVRLTPQED